MDSSVTTIPALGLAIAFIPTAIAIAILYFWSAGVRTALYATFRMLVQLLAIGYVLVYLFDSDDPRVIVCVLAFMLLVASWIAIRTIANKGRLDYLHSLIAVSVGGLFTLLLVSQAVIGIQPWFSPRYLVPLAGMIFGGSMNAVSLAAERLQAESRNGKPFIEARRVALQAAMIPITNSLFAVGLVALPGMMTGQILSGVSPLIAAKYQIVVMTMLFGAAGISAGIYLSLAGPRLFRRGDT